MTTQNVAPKPATPLTHGERERLVHWGASGAKPDPLPFSVQGERMVVDALGHDVAMIYGLKAHRAQQAAYIAHACNAYPKLVEALRDVLNSGERESIKRGVELLHELGES